MKKLTPVLILTIGFFFTIGTLWILQKNRSQPEVIKVYKTTSYQPKSGTTTRVEHPDTFVDVTIDFKTDYANELKMDDTESNLLIEEGLSPEEAIAFWEWFSMGVEMPEAEEAGRSHEMEENEGFELAGGDIEELVLVVCPV